MTGRRPTPITVNHVSIGQIVGPHGIKGVLKVALLTDFSQRFDVGKTVYLLGKPHQIEAVHWNKEQARVSLSEITDAEAGDKFRWEYLTVPIEDQIELDEDEFLTKDLIGLEVVTTQGRSLGKAADVMPSPAQDILIVEGIMIPLVHEFIKDIDLDKGVITVQLIPGMGPDEEPEEA